MSETGIETQVWDIGSNWEIFSQLDFLTCGKLKSYALMTWGWLVIYGSDSEKSHGSNRLESRVAFMCACDSVFSLCMCACLLFYLFTSATQLISQNDYDSNQNDSGCNPVLTFLRVRPIGQQAAYSWVDKHRIGLSVSTCGLWMNWVIGSLTQDSG